MKISELMAGPTRRDFVDFCNQLNPGEGITGEQSLLKFLQRRFGKEEIQNFSFKGMDLSGLNFFRANFKGCGDVSHANFSHCNLGLTFGFSKAEGVNLSGANLQQANFAGVNLDGANLSEAHADYTNFSGASLIRSNLQDTQLKFALFTWANLTQANLQRTNAMHAHFYEADLTNANITNSILIEAKLNSATLINTNFTDSNLTNAHLAKAVVSEGTKFTQTVTLKMTGFKAKDPVLKDASTGINNISTVCKNIESNKFDNRTLSNLWDSFHFFGNEGLKPALVKIDTDGTLQNIEKLMGSKNKALSREALPKNQNQIKTFMLVLKRLKIRLPKPVLFGEIIGRLTHPTAMRYDGQSLELPRLNYLEIPEALAIANDTNKRKLDAKDLTHVERENKRQKDSGKNKANQK